MHNVDWKFPWLIEIRRLSNLLHSLPSTLTSTPGHEKCLICHQISNAVCVFFQLSDPDKCSELRIEKNQHMCVCGHCKFVYYTSSSSASLLGVLERRPRRDRINHIVRGYVSKVLKAYTFYSICCSGFSLHHTDYSLNMYDDDNRDFCCGAHAVYFVIFSFLSCSLPFHVVCFTVTHMAYIHAKYLTMNPSLSLTHTHAL